MFSEACLKLIYPFHFSKSLIQFESTQTLAGIVLHALILVLGRQGQVDSCEFKTILVYIVNSSLARAIQRELCLKKQTHRKYTNTTKLRLRCNVFRDIKL